MRTLAEMADALMQSMVSDDTIDEAAKMLRELADREAEIIALAQQCVEAGYGLGDETLMQIVEVSKAQSTLFEADALLRGLVGMEMVTPADTHYEIISGHTGETIGCTTGRGLRIARLEEPKARFHRVMEGRCRSCGHRV